MFNTAECCIVNTELPYARILIYIRSLLMLIVFDSICLVCCRNMWSTDLLSVKNNKLQLPI